MTFVYPAVFTPHEKDNGFHVEFPDLECCEADGPDLEDAVEMNRFLFDEENEVLSEKMISPEIISQIPARSRLPPM